MTSARRTTGRPRHSDQVKRAPLNLTTTPELAAMIEASARRNNNSRTSEVERLVRKALEIEAGADDTKTIHEGRSGL